MIESFLLYLNVLVPESLTVLKIAFIYTQCSYNTVLDPLTCFNIMHVNRTIELLLEKWHFFQF